MKLTKSKVYNILNTTGKNRKTLEELKEYKRGRKANNQITISNWHEWDKSFWIGFLLYGKLSVVDSGVIEDLYKEIQKLKKMNGGKK